MSHKGLCDTCTRYNPRGLAHCVMARDWVRLAKKHSLRMMVTECPEYLAVEQVFPPVEEEPTPKKSRRKKTE